MKNDSLLGYRIRRFLLEHLVAERNLSINTQRSYRDTLRMLLPLLAVQSRKHIDALEIEDLSVAAGGPITQAHRRPRNRRLIRSCCSQLPQRYRGKAEMQHHHPQPAPLCDTRPSTLYRRTQS